MRVSIVLVLVLTALCAHAYADPDKTGGSQEAAIGQKLYEENQYHEAAGHFVRAYELDPQAAYLFDAAQAYRFAKDCASSAKLYRQFVDAAKQAQVQNLEKVKHYITEMDQCAKADAPKPTEPPKPLKPLEPANPPPAPPSTADLQPLPPPPPPDPGATKRHLGIAMAGAGVVVVGVGVYTHQWVGKVADERDAYAKMYCMVDAPCPSQTILDLDNRGHRDSILSITELSIGGAAIAGGVALYILGTGPANTEHPVAIVPTGRGALLTFSF